jgi:outer membrane protein TolC
MRKDFLTCSLIAASLAVTSIAFGVTGEASLTTKFGAEQGSYVGVPKFTLDQAVLTALQRNPDILRNLQEIKRTKGVIISVFSQALPQIAPNGTFQWIDPNLNSNSNLNGVSGGGGGGGGGGGFGGFKNLRSDTSYNIKVIGTQQVVNYGTWSAVRGSFFQRDSAYFGFRNILDQVIATVKTQFYQVVVDRELIKVQEESVHLLESQLKDQQNRFDAGTVPRFNVLQAEVALYNQIPQLIAARNNLRIAQIQLAKTLGLDFDPRRGINPPLDAVGEMPYVRRNISLVDAVEMGKQRRPFLKQQRANVWNQIEQVHVAIGGFLPTVNANGGGEWISSPINPGFFSNISKGWTTQAVVSWPIWDSGLAYGNVKQQRALLQETEITYDDDVRQVELEIQQAYSNLMQNIQLIESQEKNVEEAEEAVRLAKARLDAGAGVQLDVLNAQVQLTTAESTRLQALFGYNSSLAEFDRATGGQTVYQESFNGIAPRSTNSSRYDTGSNRDAVGRPRRNPLKE